MMNSLIDEIRGKGHTELPDAVTVTDLVVRRGGRTVIPGLTLSIPAGRITGLLGPSGCGKTTLMRAIVGTQIVQSGSVRVLGEPAGSPSLRSTVGYVTQSPSVYLDLTVRQNVDYFRSLYGRRSAGSGGRRSAGSGDAIDAVGLGGSANQVTGALSGGQRSRVSLVCALVAGPRLLVLDEPTVGLDPVLRAELWERFAALAAAGTTLLVSSHVMDEAEHCSGLILMRHGRLLAHESPADLLARFDESSLERAFLALVRADSATETVDPS